MRIILPTLWQFPVANEIPIRSHKHDGYRLQVRRDGEVERLFEGIVSKRLSMPYRSGPSRDWLKVRNPDSPAMIRAREAEW